MGTSTLTPNRQSFRDVLAQVAAQAKAILPEQVNGRIESAATLVLQGDVFFKDDGSIEVGSSDPARTYRLVGPTCTCKDFTDGRAPEGWCKHRVAANLLRSVERVLARRAPVQDDHNHLETPVPMVPDWVEPFPDNSPPEPELESDQDYPGKVETPAAPSLPEAPASCNVYVLIGGHRVQVTLRDTDEHRMLARLQVLLAQYPAEQSQPPAQSEFRPRQQLTPQQHGALAQHKQVTGVCAVHGVAMKLNQKEGRSWWSHYDEAAGRWCKGK